LEKGESTAAFGYGNLAITEKSRQSFLMPKVLAPSLELLGRVAELLAKLDERASGESVLQIFR
jgi:hypothetical protein